jgi:flavin-dependent dehydrogenase
MRQLTPAPRFPGVDYDVVIAGGGLAGLCLAKQLADTDPTLAIRVFDRMSSPLPAAAFKVGESTVEIGAHYFSEVIGLRDYLDREQLEKLGLRYFYGGSRGFCEESEFGVARFLPAKSYQLDRGSLEDHLREVVASSGVVLTQGAGVTDIRLGESGAPHVVSYQQEGTADEDVTCRWVIDATGRRRLLQRKLGLAKQYPTRHSAVWFRLSGRLDIDAVVTDDHESWHQRVTDPRWNSTNHLMFEGGWIWLIPLFPDNTSVGIVATESLHSIKSFNSIDKAISFIDQRLPGLGSSIRSLPVLDFHVLRGYSHSSSQVFSAERWACVGEAGAFADPYYSVGSNLIAYANGFVTKMITDDLVDRLEDDFVRHANRWFLSLAEGLTNGIQMAYPFYDKSVIMVLKTIWDFYVGWSFSDPQFYGQTYLSIAASATLSGLGARAVAAQASVLSLLAEWSRRYRGVLQFDYIDYYEDLPTLARLFVQNLPESKPRSFRAVMASMRDGLDRIEELAHVIFYLALEDALPGYLPEVHSRGWLNVTALSLDPERWEHDGLFLPRSRPRPEALGVLEQELRGLFRTDEAQRPDVAGLAPDGRGAAEPREYPRKTRQGAV